MDSLRTITDFVMKTYGFEGTVQILSGGLNNENFLITGPAGCYTIKWYQLDTPNERLDLEKEALLLLDGGSRIGAPRFIPARDGNLRTTLEGRSLSCFTFLGGAAKYSLTEAPTDPLVLSSMGRALGLIHTDLNRWTTLGEELYLKRQPAPSRRLVEFAESGAKLCANQIPHSVLQRSLKAIEDSFEELTVKGQPFIRIHGDFQPGNLFYDGPDVVEICDFEYSSWEFRIFDIAMALSILMSGSSVGRDDLDSIMEIFVKGYVEHSCIPLTDIERRALGPALVLSFLLNSSWAIPRLRDPKIGNAVQLFLTQVRTVYLDQFEKLLAHEFDIMHADSPSNSRTSVLNVA